MSEIRGDDFVYQTETRYMSITQKARQRGVAPTITGLLCGVIALLWLSKRGQLHGYGISAVLLLYSIIGGTVAFVGAFSEWVVAELY